jgi:hypothetical protein
MLRKISFANVLYAFALHEIKKNIALFMFVKNGRLCILILPNVPLLPSEMHFLIKAMSNH